jgi:hypothetical protein
MTLLVTALSIIGHILIEVLTGSKFYKAWNPVFVAEGRFSNKQPVPTLGDEDWRRRVGSRSRSVAF